MRLGADFSFYLNPIMGDVWESSQERKGKAIFWKSTFHFQVENLILKSFPWVPLTVLSFSSSGEHIPLVEHYARNGFAFAAKPPRRVCSTPAARNAQTLVDPNASPFCPCVLSLGKPFSNSDTATRNHVRFYKFRIVRMPFQPGAGPGHFRNHTQQFTPCDATTRRS